uniref:Minor capsid protein L2 n=1 Tax=Human papillomavirus TaxID=10566 RepID=A0A385PJ44_9PAPI|nr:MAG: L2 protein [Human papillomavirus]
MYRAGRSKRASAEDLYRLCKTGDCPVDVKNKIEGDTWADRLLKWFGSFIYLGGLGIGTGRGSGGSTGYRPIGVSPRPTPENIPIRPSVPIETINPPEIIPIDASGPSVVELTDLNIPDPSVIDIANPTTTLGPGEIDTVSAVDPITDLGSVGGQPTVITTTNNEVAVLEVSPIPPPKRFALDVSSSSNTSEHITVYSATTHPDPDINVFVDSSFSGEIIGDVEEIPLETFPPFQRFEIEEAGPKTSTPSQILENLSVRAKTLYNRYTQQVETSNPYFLGPVSRAVQFEFENAAFEPDVTQTFERDVAQLAAAPDTDFSQIRILHRPEYSLTTEGYVRVSRMGQRATMTTRSGLQIGQAVHFYQDLSSISPADTIELETIGDNSHISAIVNATSESTIVNPIFNENIFDESDLIDNNVEDFSNAHLVFTTTTEEGESIQIPTIPPGAPVKVFINDYGSGINIFYPNPADIPKTLIPATKPTDIPILVIDTYSDDFYLHPSFYKRKRKRSDLF